MRACGAGDSRNAAGSPTAGAVARHTDGAGLYLTNEVFLYRVVGVVARGVDALVELEDCYGLDVVRVPLGDLRARRLRVVTPELG